MTTKEFAGKIRAKYPDAYTDLDDNTLAAKIVAKHPEYKDQITDLEPQGAAAIEAERNGPGNAVEATSDEMLPIQMAVGVPGAISAPIASGLSKVGEAAADLVPDAVKAPISTATEAVGNAWDKVKSMLPNPSLKSLGYAQGAVNTEAGQGLATAAQDYATDVHPDIGALVAKAKGPVDPTALVQRAAEGDMAEPIVPQAANTEVFNQPIARGMANSTEQMRDLTNEQWKQVGDAISNTLKGLEQTGEKYDPEPLLKQIEGMYERDAAGKIMTTGVQGDTNQAISEALESMKDYAQGEPIDWTSANRIKSMLQDSGNYAARRFDQSNEAYKQVASLIKDSIDDQAQKVLSVHGGDIQDFQNLRGAYGKLSSLKSALNPAVGKSMLQPSLGEQVVGLAKKALPFGAVAALGAKATGGF